MIMIWILPSSNSNCQYSLIFTNDLFFNSRETSSYNWFWIRLGQCRLRDWFHQITHNPLAIEALKRSPTHIGSGSGVTVRPCDCTFHPFEQKLFLHALGQCLNFFLRSVWPGGKKSDLSSYLSHLTRYWSESWNLDQKIKYFYI